MLDTLNVAQTGLTVSKTQVEGVMNNLANENTPGYKARVVDTAELDHLDDRITGRGVYVEDVRRITNDYMYQNLIEEQSKQSALEELDIMLEDIESIFYETDESGLSADLQRYFESLENLRTSPQNEIYKNDLKNNANILVDSLQRLYSDVEELEENTLNNAYAMVDDINNKLNRIGELSKEITESPDKQNDLLDRRDRLEAELAEYIDIEIFRETNYQLKIGDQTAVRFDTNVHALNLVEEYIPQKDRYVEDETIPYKSNLINPTTWQNDIIEERQTVQISGNATGQVSFLGTDIAGSDGSVGHQTSTEIANDIVADKANIIANWNTNNPDREINDITAVGDQITIVYESTEGDMVDLDAASSNGINFGYSQEVQKGANSSITYKLNNEVEVSVAYGEQIDLDGDGTPDLTVDENNAIRALIHKINTNTHMLGKVTAYNGDYELDKNGEKILTNNPLHSDYDPSDPNKDRYLVIEATLDGEKGVFTGEIIVNDATTGNLTNRSHVEKSTDFSQKAEDNIHLQIFDKEVELESGKLKPTLDNIQTESGSNKFAEYKERLDNFAKALSDLSDAYIETDDGEYVYGMDAVEVHGDNPKKVEIGLFDGASVNSLKFNESKISTLSQEKLDYLATIQWKEDIDFDGTGENNSSFSKYYQATRVEIANDREDIRFRKESQDAVTESLNNTYDKLTKVDKDKEMVDLIKFQSAYEANAKIITIVDEMLATILGMKR